MERARKIRLWIPFQLPLTIILPGRWFVSNISCLTWAHISRNGVSTILRTQTEETITWPPDRMSHRKWRAAPKQHPSRAREDYQISCCLLSLHFLCDILSGGPVHCSAVITLCRRYWRQLDVPWSGSQEGIIWVFAITLNMSSKAAIKDKSNPHGWPQIKTHTSGPGLGYIFGLVVE